MERNIQADGSTTISNYDATVTYTFSPEGPAVDETGLVSGAIAATEYTVTATRGTCPSATTATFTNAAMIVTPDAPTGSAEQTIGVDVDTDATIEDLLVTNSNGSWYASEAEALATTNALPAGTLLVSGTTYYTVNVSTNGCVSTAFAVTVTVTLKNEQFDSKSFTYYPNPTLGVVNLNYANPITKIKVTNMLGQVVITQKVNATSTQVDLSNIAKGAYFIEVTSDKVSKSVKVIKN